MKADWYSSRENLFFAFVLDSMELFHTLEAKIIEK